MPLPSLSSVSWSCATIVLFFASSMLLLVGIYLNPRTGQGDDAQTAVVCLVFFVATASCAAAASAASFYTVRREIAALHLEALAADDDAARASALRALARV